MTDALALGEAVVAGGFALLAVIALVRAPKAGPSGWWAAAAFGSLGLALVAIWLPHWLGVELPPEVDGAQIVLVLAFPYLLLRFTASFRPLPRWLEFAAAAGGLMAAVTTLFSVAQLLVGEEGAAAVRVAAVFAYWAGVSLVIVVRLWHASLGQPGVARRRIRLMAAATASMTAALIVALSLGAASPWAGWTAYGLALASAAAFVLGFAPPRALRLSWRQREDEALRAATSALLRCETVQQVADILLPPAVRIMGGSGAVIAAHDGTVVASHGEAPVSGAHIGDADTGGPARESAPLGKAGRRLVVWTSAYAPFFGPEEFGLFRSMAAVGGLALDRCGLIEDERRRRDALEKAKHEADRARREAVEANLAKSEFLSRMSHELRTPLNAVLGFGQLLEISPSLSAEDREGVSYILKAGRHLLALINDVLDLSRIEAGNLAVSLEPVLVNELIQETLALVRPLASERSIRIDATDDDEHFVLTDRQRCRQVLLNLLSNAIKYNRDGGSVTVGWSPAEQGMLRLNVTDSGRGIEPSRRERLFEPFDRLGAESSGVEGTGLGLALTKHLIEHLGGSIGVDTAVGNGSTFWIEMPLTNPPTDPESSSVEATRRDATPEGRQLLLIEDNLANLRVVEAMLRGRPGITVVPAMQGTIALELAYQHHPDIIVLDLHLPDLPGREVLHRLKSDPRTADIPVIVASADATPGRIEQLLEDGAIDYVTKPLDLQRFLQAIDGALAPASP